jgi:hypothetical protein
VGRQSDIAKIKKVLLGENRSRGQLSIMSIEGPGGIGKTALFEHAAGASHLAPRRYLQLKVSSRGSARITPSGMMEDLIKSAKSPAIESKSVGHFFPHTLKAVSAVEAVRSAISSEADKKFPTDAELKGLLVDTASDLLAKGLPLAEFANAVLKRPEYQNIAKRLDQAFAGRVLRSFRSVRPEGNMLHKLFSSSTAALRNSVRRNATDVLAEALVHDLTLLLSGKSKLEGVDRLLLIFDDYEFLMQQVGELVVRHLLPRLANAPFTSVVFVLGRDKLSTTHPFWSKELADFIVDRTVLNVLELTEFVELCRHYDVIDAAVRDRIWQETSGYPYLVRLVLEEMAEQKAEGLEGPSALMLKSFYDRTTRFMSEEQRNWLEPLLFLDDINKRSLRSFFQDPEEISRVQEWFESEPSIRDPSASTFCIRPQLRRRLKEYLNRKDPDRFDTLAGISANGSKT